MKASILLKVLGEVGDMVAGEAAGGAAGVAGVVGEVNFFLATRCSFL